MTNLKNDAVAHKLPNDLKKAILANKEAIKAWNNITQLGRNEWICWVENAKKDETRKLRIKRTKEEILTGKKRPCCWAGCNHR